MDQILLERLFLVLFEDFCFKEPLNSGKRKFKRAIRTHSEVTNSV